MSEIEKNIVCVKMYLELLANNDKKRDERCEQSVECVSDVI